MSRIFLLLLVIASAVTVASFHPRPGAGIQVSVTNLRNNKGHVLISLFKDGVGYPDKPEKAFKKAKVPVSNRTASLTFESVPAGSYAIAILHDENDDAKMNTNILGLPKEGYGFSNNVMGAFGPPSLGKASFSYAATAQLPVTIKVRY